ncbi:MAG TPA: ThiF family adenylyltransferase [Blastocatellia bacterium]|nr:ThiF family adenylyltransferase [Blastocatellia bacterium]
MATEIESDLDFTTDRDATLKLIDWFEIDRVRAAKIMVIGAGAIGNEVLKNLALLGIGNIYLFDRDTIEMSNLSRSILYRASDAGKLKAETAARAIREINPSVNVIWRKSDIRFGVGLGLFRRMDVVIGCLDNRHARVATNRKCWKVDRPWIDAGIGVLNGQVAVFRPGESACYECSFTTQDYEQITRSCNQLASSLVKEGKIPTMPTMASIVAAVQVQEALKLLDLPKWEDRHLVSREFIFDGANAYVDIFRRQFNPACEAHSRIDPATIVELPERRADNTTAGQLLALARERLGADAHLELNFNIVVERRCPNPECRKTHRFLSPSDSVFQEQMQCECGHKGYHIETKNLGLEVNDYVEDFLDDRPLSKLGVPPLDILRAYGRGGRQINFELTGDFRDFERTELVET